MPEAGAERHSHLPYPTHEPGFGMPELVNLIVKRCMNSELIMRQTELGQIENLVDESVQITLGTHTVGDERRTSYIGNVKSIAAGVVIESGAVLGDEIDVGANTYIGPGAIVSHTACLGADVTMEEGSAVLIGGVIGSEGHLGQHSELSYDASLKPGEKILPGEIKY